MTLSDPLEDLNYEQLMAMVLRVINDIPTHLFSLRCKTSEEGKSNSVPLILIIPGSPGMGHFYVPFASRIFYLGGGKFDVSVISHAGHSPGHYKDTTMRSSSNCSTICDLHSATTDWYTLQDQVSHKLAFIREEASNRESLILIGHSIGCWMILNMMHELPPSQISKVFLLFPTVEKMAQSPNGQSFVSMLWNSLRIPFTGLVWVASNFIPEFIKSFILNQHFRTTPRDHLEFVTQGVKNVDEKSVYNATKMAKQEMEEVVDPPLDVIDANIDKIVFYYSVGDRWNVDSCYRDMAARYPDKEVHLCPPSFPHAFVECVSNEMAEMVYSKL